MSDFFKRKEGAGVKIPTFSEYDFSKDDTLVACGLDADTKEFVDRNKLFISDMLSMSSAQQKGNRTALVAKSIESHFSTREMAFLLSKFMVEDLVKQLKEKDGK